MNINQIYWIAALLEGEGSFSFETTPRIQLKMTDEDIVLRARSLMKPNAKIRVGIMKNIKHKTNYTFYVLGDPAISWMFTIYSLMGRRRKEKIREIIIKWKEMTGKNIGNLMHYNAIRMIAKYKKISFDEANKLFNESLQVN